MINFSNLKIKYRRDTIENWEENNPILGDGELVIVQIFNDDNNEFRAMLKCGDGINHFTDLPYLQ